jgi:hypothetical protein
MNRSQLEHIIRAAGSIADDREIIVLWVDEGVKSQIRERAISDLNRIPSA